MRRHQLLFSSPSRSFAADSLHIDRTYCFSGVDEILYFEAQSRVMGFSRSPCFVYHFIPPVSLSACFYVFIFFKRFNTAGRPSLPVRRQLRVPSVLPAPYRLHSRFPSNFIALWEAILQDIISPVPCEQI